ncbi:MAG: rod shape-determining protein RodA [Myxococcota bacterium]
MLNPSHRTIENFPWLLVITTLILCGLAIINLSSAAKTAHTAIYLWQLAWFGIGIVCAGVVTLIDYRIFQRMAYLFLGIVFLMLIAVLLVGKARMGAQRWLVLGPITLQPSELLKLGLALALAKYFAQRGDSPPYSLGQLIVPGLLILVPTLPVLKQPDLGTSVVILLVGCSIVLFYGIKWRSLVALILLSAAISVVGWFTFLKEYQKRRILTFLNPESDALGAGYHANQSIIAIGSGEMYGKGHGQGTQTQLSFLPEQHTDFVFSVWAEEHGFIGVAIVIALYIILIIAVIAVSIGARDRFGQLVVVGCAAIIFWQTLINISMVTGLMPVVGITLPLFSYGGSSVLTVFISIGLVINISLRRYLF